MPGIKATSINDVVVLEISPKGDHKLRFERLSVSEAHELVMQVLEAIDGAQGFKDAMDGNVSKMSRCPTCKARNVTAGHACRRVR